MRFIILFLTMIFAISTMATEPCDFIINTVSYHVEPHYKSPAWKYNIKVNPPYENNSRVAVMAPIGAAFPDTGASELVNDYTNSHDTIGFWGTGALTPGIYKAKYEIPGKDPWFCEANLKSSAVVGPATQVQVKDFPDRIKVSWAPGPINLTWKSFWGNDYEVLYLIHYISVDEKNLDEVVGSYHQSLGRIEESPKVFLKKSIPPGRYRIVVQTSLFRNQFMSEERSYAVSDSIFTAPAQ